MRYDTLNYHRADQNRWKNHIAQYIIHKSNLKYNKIGGSLYGHTLRRKYILYAVSKIKFGALKPKIKIKHLMLKTKGN
jgi:hypothetical protein